MTAVSLRGVTLGYPARPVLTGIDLAIEQGEFIGLFGANGAGKTTLLRGLLGLIRPAQGTISVLGGPARPGRAGVGYLPQTRDGEVPALRGADVLCASVDGARWGWPFASRGARAAVHAALDEVGAGHLAARPLADLSGGERQRVDEPMAGLDPRHQQEVVGLLQRVQAKFGLTVLCSAHDVNVLLGVMDRVLYLGGGGAALGTVDEVVTPAVLSRLYGAPMAVVRAGGRIFVGAGMQEESVLF